MANKRPNRVVDTIIRSNISRAKKDLTIWRSALRAAEDVNRPRRHYLYQLYHELVLDTTFIKESKKRLRGVRKSAFSVYDLNTGEADADLTAMLVQPWFYQLLEYAIDTNWWGHSLVQIDEFELGQIKKISLIDRRHVRPESHEFVKSITDEKGVNYAEDAYYDWLFEFGKTDDLGLLNPLAPNILFKRFAKSAWSEFCEIFGMGIRTGKTNTRDTQSVDRMEQMMIDMGRASYAVIDKDEELEIVQTNKSDGKIYEGLINLCKSEISEAMIGAVTGTDSQGGSRSKEEVGERTGNDAIEDDKEMIEGYMNTQIIPKLVKLGYPLEGKAFRFEKAKDMDQIWKVVQGLLTHYNVDEEFINETFGVPVEKRLAPTDPQLKGNPVFF